MVSHGEISNAHGCKCCHITLKNATIDDKRLYAINTLAVSKETQCTAKNMHDMSKPGVAKVSNQ